jgi:hypothetical protein
LISFKGYSVDKGRIEFIEPDNEGQIHTLELSFDPQETQQTLALIKAVWHHVHKLQFPDTRSYSASLSGIRNFEQDLIDEVV